jgi:hypothetical protein
VIDTYLTAQIYVTSRNGSKVSVLEPVSRKFSIEAKPFTTRYGWHRVYNVREIPAGNSKAMSIADKAAGGPAEFQKGNTREHWRKVYGDDPEPDLVRMDSKGRPSSGDCEALAMDVAGGNPVESNRF